MRKIKLNLSDLLSVLEQLALAECEEILIYEGANGYPVIVDAEHLEDLISFAPVDEDGNELPTGTNEDNGEVH